MNSLSQSLWALLPETTLLLAAVTIMTACAFLNWSRTTWSVLTGAAFGAAFLALLWVSGEETDPYASAVSTDALGFYGRLFILLTGPALLLLTPRDVGAGKAGEFYGCLLLIHCGAMLTACANDLATLFLALELVSVPTYLLLFLTRRSDASLEAGTKYFLLSVFSSAALLFGMAYLYGLTGTTNLRGLAFLLNEVPESLPAGAARFGTIALLFTLGGLCFRLAAAPFHFYAPDVYQGTSTGLAALLAWIPKGVGCLAIIRALTSIVGGDSELARDGMFVAWVIAIATMTVGNAMALLQSNLKRLLAYSSIAHAGYLMAGVAVAFGNPVGEPGTRATLGAESVLTYLAAYALMTLGAFAAILSLRGEGDDGEPETLQDLAGLARSRPGIALGMATCLMSLAGLPPTLGFLGKFQVFQGILESANGPGGGAFLFLAVAMALNAAVGAYYYLKIAVAMYLGEPGRRTRSYRVAPAPAVAMTVCALGSILFGLTPGVVTGPAREAAVAASAIPEPMAAAVETAGFGGGAGSGAIAGPSPAAVETVAAGPGASSTK